MAATFLAVPAYLERRPVLGSFAWRELFRDKDRVGVWASLTLRQQLTVLAYMATLLAALFAWSLGTDLLFGQVRRRHLGGALMTDQKQGTARAKKLLRRAGGVGFRLGPVWLPFKAGRSHVLLVGATDSGKTQIIKMLLRSVLPTWRRATLASCSTTRRATSARSSTSSGPAAR